MHAGFSPDNANGYCYKVLQNVTTRVEGEKLCENDFDAEMLLFDTNSEVDGLIGLFKSGIHLINLNSTYSRR